MRLFKLLPVLFAASLFVSLPRQSPAQSAEKPRTQVLVITGGHGFEKEPFFKLFQENPAITYQAVEHPKAHALLTADAAKAWDVLVLYDMHQEIADAAKADRRAAHVESATTATPPARYWFMRLKSTCAPSRMNMNIRMINAVVSTNSSSVVDMNICYVDTGNALYPFIQ